MSRGPNRKATEEELLWFLITNRKPSIGTGDVGRAFDVSNNTARKWLEDLADQGLVAEDAIGPTTIFWILDPGRQRYAELSSSVTSPLKSEPDLDPDSESGSEMS